MSVVLEEQPLDEVAWRQSETVSSAPVHVILVTVGAGIVIPKLLPAMVSLPIYS